MRKLLMAMAVAGAFSLLAGCRSFEQAFEGSFTDYNSNPQRGTPLTEPEPPNLPPRDLGWRRY